VLELLWEKESILDGQLTKLSIHVQENPLVIDLGIGLMYSKKFRKIILQVVGVLEYSFTYYHTRSFYNIEDYKLFQKDDFFYISLDPVDGTDGVVDENDNDYILGLGIRLFA
jgi:hypothetical protein